MHLSESVAAYSAAPRELVRKYLTEDVKAGLADFIRSPQAPVAFTSDTLRELIAMDVLALDATGRPRPNTAIFLAADFVRLYGPIQELAIGTAEAVRANAGSLSDAPPAVRNFVGGIMGMNQGLHAILRALGLTQDWPAKTGHYERTKVDLNEACPEHDRFGPDLQVKRVHRGQRYTSVVIGDGGGDYHSHLLAARRAATTDATRAYFTALADHLTDALPRMLLEVGDDAGVDVYCFGPGVVATPGATGAFDELAVRYGLPDRDAFVSQTGMPLMSAELAATGLVGTVLHAHDFHGQDCFTSHGLNALGLGADGELLAPADATPTLTPKSAPTAPSTPAATDAATAVGAQSRLDHLADLSRRTEAVLRDNIREYSELSMFQKPVIKRMFQSATGLRIEEWLAQAEAMTARLNSVAAGGNLSTIIPAAQVSDYIAQLRRMAAYFVKQESDARGWFKDPAKLALAIATLKERHDAFADLANALATALNATKD